MSAITLVAALTIAIVFGWGAVAKLARLDEWKQVLRVYGLPPRALPAASVLVPVAELTAAGLLLASRARAGAALTLGLLALFSPAFVAVSQREGGRVPCGCFGRATPHDPRLLIARNASLALLAGIVLIDGRDRLFGASLPSASFLVPASLVVLGVVLVLGLARELQTSRRP